MNQRDKSVTLGGGYVAEFDEATPNFEQSLTLNLEAVGLTFVKAGKAFHWLMTDEKFARYSVTNAPINPQDCIFIDNTQAKIFDNASGEKCMALPFGYFVMKGLMSEIEECAAEAILGYKLTKRNTR